MFYIVLQAFDTTVQFHYSPSTASVVPTKTRPYFPRVPAGGWPAGMAGNKEAYRSIKQPANNSGYQDDTTT